MLLDIGENPLILLRNEVDSNSLTTETSTTPNSERGRMKRLHVAGVFAVELSKVRDKER